jgi:hypothetical protein
MTIDHQALSVVMPALTLLADEAAKGFAGEAGKTAWAKIKSILHIKDGATAEALISARSILESNPAALREVYRVVRESPATAALVGQINAEKVNVIGTVEGDLKIDM